MKLYDLDSWAEVFATMRANKVRTVLTAWGVFWGIFMLVVALGFGDGMRRGVTSKMDGKAANAVFVWGMRTTLPYAGFKPGRWIAFQVEDIEAVKNLEGLEHLAPRLRLGGFRQGVPVSRGSETGGYEVYGDYPAVRHIEKLIIHGRFINPLDLQEARKVAVIGPQVYTTLFPAGEDPIGELIRIRGVAFEVVGTFDVHTEGDRRDRDEQKVYIPFTSFQQSFNSGNRINFFALTAESNVEPSDLEQRFRAVLMERHKVNPADKRALGSWNMGERFKKIERLFTAIDILLWLVGIATLLAGALGVSNIMLISVKERTKEIGIRKALGAKPGQIVRLIMAESIVLTSVAGYLGLVVAVGLLEFFGDRIAGGGGPLAHPQVDIKVALIATAVLIVSGAIAGIIPATHAARVSPIESLRAE